MLDGGAREPAVYELKKSVCNPKKYKSYISELPLASTGKLCQGLKASIDSSGKYEKRAKIDESKY